MSRAAAHSPQLLMSGDELSRSPGRGRCELVEGRVVPMSPTGYVHGKVELRFVAALRAFVALLNDVARFDPASLAPGPLG